MNISIMVEYIWHKQELNHESWNVMNTGTIKEVAYIICHQSGRYSTQTNTSTCPTMWIEVLRSNIVVHHLITSHWCILLTEVRSPTDNENGNQGDRVKNNKCKYMCSGRTLKSIHRSRDIDVFPKTVGGERTCHWWLQVSRHSKWL